ncbi:hypothetical protein PUN4_840045 [Paraburkholderia unamae]|nr:hypothetical protein PUN4_840045 [Paraburkholderia unamae]
MFLWIGDFDCPRRPRYRLAVRKALQDSAQGRGPGKFAGRYATAVAREGARRRVVGRHSRP